MPKPLVRLVLAASLLGCTVPRESHASEVLETSQVDRAPRVIHQPPPLLEDEVCTFLPGQVLLEFIVCADGSVISPRIRSSTHPAFESPALAAVTSWRFEPAELDGERVPVRMRVPLLFPKS